jgi:hypothetical protein
MSESLTVTREERRYLRELAAKQLVYAHDPRMAERTGLWYRHNSLRGERPMIVMEMDTFEGDMLPAPRCESPAAVEIERSLLRHIISHEEIDDDKVVPAAFIVPWRIAINEFGIAIPTEHGVDARGGTVGYHWTHPIKTLKQDFHKLKPATFAVDREGTLAWKTLAEEVLGDILPVEVKNSSLRWHFAPSAKVVQLMGLEAMMISMIDEPDEMHALFAYLRDNMLAYARWQEAEKLLTLNNDNDYTGAGSYGFTNELPTDACQQSGRVTTRDLWLNMNSQETVSISPRMYHRFIHPYYCEIAEPFGLTYYGCCEPVHDIWEKSVSELPHLRKVSISAWCNEEYMGQALRGGRVIYSRKPSPNYIGVGEGFDKEGFAHHIRKTLLAARGCTLEIIFRDVYTLTGDRTKPGRAVQITRRLIDELWQG